jgi:hypothetical protein
LRYVVASAWCQQRSCHQKLNSQHPDVSKPKKMPREVSAADIQQVVAVTRCSAERARRALEQHSIDFAINYIFDEPNEEPSKIQKTSHMSSPSGPNSPPSAFTSVKNTPSKDHVPQGEPLACATL